MVLAWLLFAFAAANATPARAAEDYGTRLRALERTAQTFLTDKTLFADQQAQTERINRYNAALAGRVARFEAQAAAFEQTLAPLRELEAQIKASRENIPARPDDNADVRRYNQAVETHNQLVTRHTELSAQLKPTLDAQREKAEREQKEIEAERAKIVAEANRLQKRFAAWESFRRNGGDLRYQNAVNDLLADIRRDLDTKTTRGADLLTRVRALRRQLAEWAIAQHESYDHGLMIVEVTVVDEPCFMIFDTGAATVTLPLDIVRALRLQGRLGDESTIEGVGGARVPARPLQLPVVSVLGRESKDVGAYALAGAEGVGIDGLLGQTVLKDHRVIVDRSAKPMVKLEPVTSGPAAASTKP